MKPIQHRLEHIAQLLADFGLEHAYIDLNSRHPIVYCLEQDLGQMTRFFRAARRLELSPGGGLATEIPNEVEMVRFVVGTERAKELVDEHMREKYYE